MKIRRDFGRALLLLAFALLPACADDSRSASQGDSDIFFPTWTRSGEPEPAGAISGRLTEQDGCLFIEQPTLDGPLQFLPLWPDTYGLIGGATPSIENDEGLVFEVGQSVTLGGGTWNPRSEAEELIGQEIPTRCRAEAWLATDIAAEQGD